MQLAGATDGVRELLYYHFTSFVMLYIGVNKPESTYACTIHATTKVLSSMSFFSFKMPTHL